MVKRGARKVRTLYHDRVVAGFAGTAADAFTLFSRFEGKLEEHRGNLPRAAVELAKDWRSDRVLRRLEAMLAVADRDHSFIVSGNGDVIEPDDGLDRHRLRRPLRAGRRPRPRSPTRTSTPRPWCWRPCASPPASASTPTTTSRWRRCETSPIALGRMDPAGMNALHAAPQIVAELDRYIVGQDRAKRAVAVALRNRWRRQQPARRAARRGRAQEHHHDRAHRGREDRDRAPPGQAGPGAPFVKVEATKYTEVGYVGRDVGVDRPRPHRDRRRAW